MTFVLFLLYLAVGGGVGYGAYALTTIGLPLSITAGAITTAILGQIHIVAGAGQAARKLESRVATVEKSATETSRRLDVIDARTDAIEATVTHELTERRDELVAEMKQLEMLIDRLSRAVEAGMPGSAAHATSAGAAPAGPREDTTLRDVKNALKEGRVDLHLQPIVSLPPRRVSFYEGLTRLRRPDGSLILPAEFLDPARRANLMGLIDSWTLFRCVQIVRRLAERDRRVGVFCNISASSLEDPSLFQMLLEFMAENRDLSGSLIFEIRADKFETRSAAMKANMEQLNALGFRFSLDHVTDLSLDLPRLQAAGVRFVKMNGTLLIDQLRDPHAPRPISAMNRRPDGKEVAAIMSRHGVTMIAEKIEDEASVIEILDYVAYGQGIVFGPPRPIKSSLMEDTAPPQALIDRLAKFG